MYTGACCLTYLMWFDTKPDSMFSVNEYLLWGFPCGSAGQESAYNVGDPGSIPGLGRSPGEGKGWAIRVFLSGEFHELCSPWGRKDWDTNEHLSLSLFSTFRGLKKCTSLGVCVRFYLGQKEDCSLGDSPSDSSEKWPQRGVEWGGQYNCDFGEGGVHAIKRARAHTHTHTYIYFFL